MILCLAIAHASIFNTSRQVFFSLNQRVKLFLYVIFKFYQQKFFGNFLFDSPSFINTNFNVRNS